MGKVIIVANPTPTSPDKPRYAIVIEQDQMDDYRESVGPNKLVEFDETTVLISVGDIAECNITSGTTCVITRVVRQATWAQGKVTAIDVPVYAGNRVCTEFKIEVLCDPNPFGKELGGKLLITTPTSEDHQVPKVGDTVAALTTTSWELCETSKVI